MELSPEALSYDEGLRRIIVQEASRGNAAFYNSSVSSREKRSENGAREARSAVQR